MGWVALTDWFGPGEADVAVIVASDALPEGYLLGDGLHPLRGEDRVCEVFVILAQDIEVPHAANGAQIIKIHGREGLDRAEADRMILAYIASAIGEAVTLSIRAAAGATD